ncbi:uncharacterized protein LOC124450597 [Xenia sp. Carnegie-2017]|uniref:uncharacterized protein LOC124450597 n=1 Tax=Xenia sp. Carnegie-2017 TaxID=2897299 RepID=UPI001F03A5C5|nr:uncharacterized protein LOC124450597 [Xenia sp. Carnegie-2017]
MALKLFVLFFFLYKVNNEQIPFENCDRSAPIQIHIISLPIPIEVTPEKVIEPSVSFTNENYTATNNDTEITLDMKLKKVVGLIEIDLTSLMQFFIPKSMKCGDLQRHLSIPLCPQRQDMTRQPLFYIPSMAVKYLKNGKYKITADIHEKLTGKRVLCVNNLEVEIKVLQEKPSSKKEEL